MTTLKRRLKKLQCHQTSWPKYILSRGQMYMWQNKNPNGQFATRVTTTPHSFRRIFNAWIRADGRGSQEAWIAVCVEDDIRVPKQAMKCWVQYLPQFLQNKYFLGFVRIEIDSDQTKFIVDLPNIQFNKLLIFVKKII